MPLPRPSSRLWSAYTLGAGFGIARRLFQGFSIDRILAWITRAFGTMDERSLLELVEHGRLMRDAGLSLTNLAPGGQITLNNIPVNPWLSEGITEGSRIISELIVPWQDANTGREGEWYWRIRSASEPTFEEIVETLDTVVKSTMSEYDLNLLERMITTQISVGEYIGVSSVRKF